MALGHSITVNDEYTALDPTPLLAYLRKVGRPYEHVDRCNRIILPSGREYGRAWLLMRAKDAHDLYAKQGYEQNTSDTQKNPAWNIYRQRILLRPIELDDPGKIEIKRLAISRVFSVLGWNEDPRNSEELQGHYAIVEFVDARYTARMSTVYKSYNVRTFNILDSSDNPQYWDASLNGVYPWTWAEVVSDLFGLLPSGEFGSSNVDVTRAIYPTHYPMDLKFGGISAWDAICEILHNTGNVISRDQGGKWWVESRQTAQPTSEYDPDYLSKFLEDPTWDLPRDSATTANINIPEKLMVYFPRMFHAFNTLADTKCVDGGDAWDGSPLYNLEKTVNSLGVAGTKVGIFSSLYADYDEQGNILNASQLDSVADEMVAEFKAAKGWTQKSLHNTYLFYHDIECGSEVSAVQWYNVGGGGRTEVLCSPFKFTPGDELSGLGHNHISEIQAWECFAPPDFNRKHHPVTRFLVARMDATLTIGGTASASVHYGTHSGAGAISWVDSGKNIQVHNVLPIEVSSGEYVACFWHLQTRRWVVVYTPPATCPEVYEGTLDGLMCWNQSAYSSDLHNIFCCDTLETTALENPYHLAGLPGFKILVYRDCLTNTYKILQVEHQSFTLVTGFDRQDGCEYSPGVGRTIPTRDCKITYRHRDFSVMTCKTTTSNTDLLVAVLVDSVLTDWWVEGLEIKGTKQPIFAVCACDPYEVLLHTGTDCAASGSGSGA